IIDGYWYDMATPTTTHQRLVNKISYRLNEYIEKKGGDCEVFPAPYSIFLNERNRTYVEPDISVVCDPDKIREDGCHGAPDFVIEVTSPSTIRKDMAIKLFKYRTEGVKEYWIVNPDERNTMRFVFADDVDDNDGGQTSFDDELISHIYPDFKIRLADYV
ncbi:MAG: Uma2 family endonuclease, partial [Lachnospiraceae bacterium]|nr:Uma2 family endonuclease [Lachnospiraceae bacterium]